MATLCSIDNCHNQTHARGWCRAHYKRYQRYGDPQAGSTMIGQPLQYFFEVVLSYDGDECLTWPFGKSHGYAKVRINGQSKLVSRAVCEAINGPPPTPLHEAAHSCGKGHLACVAKRHLSWKTHVENMQDKVVHGTHQIGERGNTAKLTNADVMQIRSLRGKKFQRDIAREFGVCIRTVASIHLGQTWSHLPILERARWQGRVSVIKKQIKLIEEGF